MSSAAAVELVERQPASSPQMLNADDLRELMQTVTETTQQLHATHLALQEQVRRLQADLAEANAKLRRSESLAALGQMAAGIAHEVRNPLGSIQLYAQLLSEDVAQHPEQAALCAKISRAVVGLDAIVRDVLHFARETRIQPSEVAVAGIIDQAIESCASLIAAKRVQVRIVCDAEMSLHADRQLLVQAIANIVRNAVEAMDDTKSPQLEIATGRRMMCCPDGSSAERAVISICDNGPGIPDEVVERMFNPFYTTRATGTGLGLAIVHRIVDAHGGHIDVRRSSIGGAQLDVCLPLDQGIAGSACEIETTPVSAKQRPDRAMKKQEGKL